MYIDPLANKNDFVRRLGDIVDDNFRPANSVLLTGDLNIDLLNKNDATTRNLESIMKSRGLSSCIDKVTRNASGTALDHTWSRLKNKSESYILLTDISDHYPCLTSFDLTVQDDQWTKIQYRVKSERNSQEFKNKLHSTDFNFAYNKNIPINDRFKTMTDKLFETYNETHPIKSKNVKNRKFNNKWLTVDIKNSINQKHKLYANYKNNLIPEVIYKSFKASLKRTIKEAKKQFFTHKFNSIKDDPKMYWKNLNSLLNSSKNKDSLPKTIYNDNADLNNEQEICDGFNNYFSTIAESAVNQIPPTEADYRDYLGTANLNIFNFEKISPIETKIFIKKFQNKNCNVNDIPVYIYKISSDIISEPLTFMINESLETGTFPDSLKCARIRPIFKKGNKQNIKNYRPISILPFFSKLIEKMVHKQLIFYLNLNNIISQHQFGFLKNTSTEHALINIIESIYKNLEGKESTISVFLDLSKAFDVVDHGILLHKLSYYGVRGFPYQWFCSYLNNRSHYVKINDKTSSTVNVNLGVPQGSILGPLLFLLYVNDMSSAVNSKIIQYADDTTMITSDSDMDRLTSDTNQDLIKIYQWLCANKLCLNKDKSHFLLITNKKNPPDPIIRIGGRDIAQSRDTKVLGLTIDNKLNFSTHLNHVANKLTSVSYAIYKLRDVLSSNILKTIYNALALPFLNYASVVWGQAPVKSKYPVMLIQRQLIRNISSAEFLAHSTPLFKNLKLLKLNDIIKLNTCLLTYKIKNNMTPALVTEIISCNQSRTNRYNVRTNPLNLCESPYMMEVPRRSISCSGVKLWNALPNEFKSLKSLNSLKKNLKMSLIDEY